MASLKTALTVSPDELFQRFSISEIKEMYNDLEKEVNKKTDELRVLVGGKYRDFVEISEKIDEMNNIAEDITNATNAISNNFTLLNMPVPSENLGREKLKNVDKCNTISVLIKLLIDIENQIWNELEYHKYIVATTLLQLAVYIKTAISLESSWKIDGVFPVFHLIWNSILRFPVIITQSIEKKLKSNVLLPATACECLCSLTILENLSFVDVIKRFLTFRMETLEYVMSNENLTQKVRARILNSFHIIISTIEILYQSFHVLRDGQIGDYWKSMTAITAPNCERALNTVEMDNTTKFAEIYILPILQNFKIKTTKLTVPLNGTECSTYVNDWLKSVAECISVRLSNLLDLVGSLQTLNLLKQSVPGVHEDWISIMEYFNLKRDLNVWQELYAPLITKRTKDLLSQRWDAIFARICHKIETSVNEINEREKREAESNLHCSLWNSFEEDFVETSSSDGKLLYPKGLIVKSFGLSPNAGKLCNFVEALVFTMTNELSNIYSSKQVYPDECNILKEHQQSCCSLFIKKLITFIQEIVNSVHENENILMFLARFSYGLSLFCESLKQCILLPDEKGEKWHSVSTKLNETSLNLWSKWSALEVSVIFEKFHSSTTQDTSSSAIRIHHFPKWDSFKITEEAEDGTEIDFEVSVPVQPSFSIQKILNSFVSLVGRTLPPRSIITGMINNFLLKIFDFFYGFEKTTLHQMVYMQYLFDAKYLTALLIPFENDTLTVLSNKSISNLQKKIDPVDLDVISIQLSQNVAHFVVRTQDIFGILIIDKPRLSNDSYTDNTGNPLVVQLGAPNVPWFALLPISTNFESAPAEHDS